MVLPDWRHVHGLYEYAGAFTLPFGSRSSGKTLRGLVANRGSFSALPARYGDPRRFATMASQPSALTMPQWSLPGLEHVSTSNALKYRRPRWIVPQNTRTAAALAVDNLRAAIM